MSIDAIQGSSSSAAFGAEQSRSVPEGVGGAPTAAGNDAMQAIQQFAFIMMKSEVEKLESKTRESQQKTVEESGE